MTKKNDFKYRKKRFSNTVAYKLLMTLDVLFAVFCLTLIVLYVIGNYQNFLDESQHLILGILEFCSIFTILMSFFLSIETIIKIITENSRVKRIFNLIYLIITIILCSVFIVISGAINFVSLGG